MTKAVKKAARKKAASKSQSKIGHNPASYTDASLQLMGSILNKSQLLKTTGIGLSIIDPMAGSGKVVELRNYITHKDSAERLRFRLNDLERWKKHPGAENKNPNVRWTFESAYALTAEDGTFDVLITSPTYGNRMADHHTAKDGSDRQTYTHRLGKQLHPQNTGKVHFGLSYRLAHERIYRECARVLHPSGIAFFVVADFIRRGERVRVTDATLSLLKTAGFHVVKTYDLPMNHFRRGANYTARVGYETVIQCRLQNGRRKSGSVKA